MRTSFFLKNDVKTSQDLSAGPLLFTTAFAQKFKLEQVQVHFSQAVTETVTVTISSADGSNYSAILQSVNLIAETDFVYRPQGEMNFQMGDELKVQCTNANLTGTAFLKIKASEM